PHGTALLLDSTDAVPIQETPHRSAAAWDLRLGHRPNDLIQLHVRLFFDQPRDKVLVLFQRRHSSAAWLGYNVSCCVVSLRPNDHNARAKPKLFRGLAPRCARCDSFNHPFTQAHRIRSRHRSPRPKRINAADSRILKSLRIPSFDSKRAKTALTMRKMPLRKIELPTPNVFSMFVKASSSLATAVPAWL